MRVTFLPEHRTTEVEAEGLTLLSIASSSGVAIDGGCGGKGTCGKCKVRILKGNTPDAAPCEKLLLTEQERESGYRLSCCFIPSGDTDVLTAEFEEMLKRKENLTWIPADFKMQKRFQKKHIFIRLASLEDQRSDERRILEGVGGSAKLTLHPSLLKEIPPLMTDGGRSGFTVTICGNQVVHIEEGNREQECFGIAFDMGTTTVVGMLWNLLTGELMAASAVTNPQEVFGSDVIARISYAGESRENLAVIRSKIIDCLDGLIGNLTEKAGIGRENVYDMTAVGNTTMSHLLIGADPSQLARAPFAPVFCAAVRETAAGCGLGGNPAAGFYLLPNLAGHVGSDITAGILASGMARRQPVQLLLDIGTNGEIVLAKEGVIMTCSAAAGPAFEGASISNGMRAAAGAVEAVETAEGDIKLRIIGNRTAVGLCGSGILDAVAVLAECGIIDRTGKMLGREKLQQRGLSPGLLGRVREGTKGREFVLAFGDNADDIVITQKDIREVQLAKAAIQAGTTLMLRQLQLKASDISQVYIAGAFGSHIKIESAVSVGIVPGIERNRISYIGNAAGTGAAMALLSQEARQLAEGIALNIVHLELAGQKDFQEEYLKAMSIGN